MLFKKSCEFHPNCDWVKNHLSAYLDRALQDDEVSAIHQHLRFCRWCSAELDVLCRTLSALTDFREEPLPASIRNFRVPRSLFMDVIPFFQDFREQKRELKLSSLLPYFSASLLLFMVALVWVTYDNYDFKQHYNSSNYVEVRATFDGNDRL